MLNRNQVFLRVAKRQLLSRQFVLRNAAVKSSCRCLSSASPVFQEDDDVDTGVWSRKQEATKRMVQQGIPVMPTTDTAFGPSSHSVEDDCDANNDADAESFQIEPGTGSSPSELTYTGNATIPITTQLHIVTPDEDTPSGIWPIFRLMVSFRSFSENASWQYRSHESRQNSAVVKDC
jgi:hypothetical protein